MVIFKSLVNNEIRLEVPVPDFIPYACHYDASTIITKNGDLLQIIKIVGFSFETIGAQQTNLRDIIRKAIVENIDSDRYSIWFHTIRVKKNLDPGGDFSNKFSEDLHKAWDEKNYWNDKYVNELYVTIIHDGKNFKIKNYKDFLSSFSFYTQRQYHNQHIEKIYQQLDKVVGQCLTTLEEFGAKKLTVMVDDEGAFSEPLQFFYKIMYLTEKRIAVPIVDLSQYLATHQIAFGNNAFEVRDEENKYFGAVLSVKEYHELSLSSIDQFLQLPQELIVSQSIKFIDKKTAQAPFEYQNYILKVSGDQELKKLLGLENIMNGDTGKETDFCYQQLTITLIAKNLKKLDSDVKLLSKRLSKLGIVAIREDINIENCFWAQLPANFSFIRRVTEISSKNMAGFASLHNFPAGNLNSIWGKALTIFRTAAGTPYFFNFHSGNIGHSFIIGPVDSGKMTLINFLISESVKYNPIITIFETKQRSKLLVKALEGNYHLISENNSEQHFNPLLLEDNPENRAFLKKWILSLSNNLSNIEYEEQKLDHMINSLYKLEPTRRKLNNLKEFIDDEQLISQLSLWHGEGKYAQIFNHDSNNFNSLNLVNGYNINFIMSDQENLTAPLFLYFIHMSSQQLEGRPAIFVLNDGWQIINHTYFVEYLSAWMDFLTESNAIFILTAELTKNDAIKPLINKVLNQKMVTRIFLPSAEADIYKDLFDLSEEELTLVKNMKATNRHFLLNQGEDTIIGELNLSGLTASIGILSGEERAEKLIDLITKDCGNSTEEWWPRFYEQYK